MAREGRKEPAPAGGAFARDLGYLDAFFDKLEAHARTLDPARGARLAGLIREERQRWTEIRALLSGAPVTPPTAPASEAPRGGRREFTIGPLRKGPR